MYLFRLIACLIFENIWSGKVRSMTEIAIYSEIEALVGRRDAALSAFEALQASIRQINGIAEGAMAAGNPWAPELELRFRKIAHGRIPPFEATKEVYRQALDEAAWLSLMERAGLREIMGKRQRDEMKKALRDECPPFDIDTVRATFARFRDDGIAIARRTLVDVFDALCPSLLSHDGFKIGERIIHRDSVTWCTYQKKWNWWSGPGRDALIDLDRIAHRIDGKPFTYMAADAVNAAMAEGKDRSETDYFELRWFRAGTLHIRFKRQDILDAMNREIAAYFGASLAKGNGRADPRRQEKRACSA